MTEVKHKEEEELRKVEEKDERREEKEQRIMQEWKLEVERKRKEKLAERKRLEEEGKLVQEKIEAKIQKKREIEEKKRAIEKEIFQDLELAMQIFQDERPAAMEESAQDKALPSVPDPRRPVKRDLSGWKYAQIRDTVNTSTDIALLEACREEFHRRLKVYNNWKARNATRTGATKQRAQQVLLEDKNSASMSQMQTYTGKSKPSQVYRAQRFFRIPFNRRGSQHIEENIVKRGCMYLHFDGDYIARQIELHPDKPPLFLVAGKDDMQICELSLNQTGLTRRKGAEILQKDFEQIWTQSGSGGPDYLQKAISSGQASRPGAEYTKL